MKKFFHFLIPVLGFYSCNKEIPGSITGPAEVDVYVAGADSVFSDLNGYPLGISTYWKNGSSVKLRDCPCEDGAMALSIAVSGNDVFTAGYRRIIGNRNIVLSSMFWKNGIDDGSRYGFYELRSLIVSNNDRYMVGYGGLWGFGEKATYFKDEEQVELSDGSAGSVATSIAVSGNDVYVAGIGVKASSLNGDQNGIAKYWKNSKVTNLTDGSNYAIATSIAVSGSDVYVAGTEWDGQSYLDVNSIPARKPVAKYWKNNKPVNLTDGIDDAVTKSIVISENDVYVAGTEWDGQSYKNANGYTVRKSVAKYWKNGNPVNLTDGTMNAEAKSIAVSGKDVYVAGMVNGHATYWKNGVAVKLSDAESEANSILLVKK